MYLKEMGGVELLSREGEIAIAKRIEAAKEVLIGTVYECASTIESINNWKLQLETGQKLLRDIIDLDASVEQDESIEIEEPSNINIEHKSKISLLNEENNNINLNKRNNDSEKEKKSSDEDNLENDEELDDEIDDDQDNTSMSLAMLENLVRDQVMNELSEFSSNSKKILKHQSKSIDYC